LPVAAPHTHSKTVVPGPAALDLNGQDANGGTKPSRPLASRTTRALPPDPCSHSPIDAAHWYYQCSDGTRRPWYCERWDCPDCAELKASRWADIITVASPQRHIVITRLGPDPQEARGQLRNIVKAVRRGQAHGSGSRLNRVPFEYFAALETHSCGFIHAHLLQRGHSIPKPAFSAMLPQYGAGSICWLRSISSAERPGAVSRYVARHLIGRAHYDQAKIGRRIRYSRNFWNGCTAAQVASALWPRQPDARTWKLVGPSRRISAAAFAAYRELAAESAHRHRLEMMLGDSWDEPSYQTYLAARASSES